MRRVILPDSHGSLADPKAVSAALRIIKVWKPDEIVLLGDCVDASGIYSRLPAVNCDDAKYSPANDFAKAKAYLGRVRDAAPKADIHYLEGNHEEHIDRWIANNIKDENEREVFRSTMGCFSRLNLGGYGIFYYPRTLVNVGVTVPGFLRLDGCLFTHGEGASKHATSLLLDRHRQNIVHGHTHRAVCLSKRMLDGNPIIAACPGTLSKLQMFYNHTSLTEWTHGVGLQEWNGKLWHFNVAIQDGEYRLP